MPESYRFTVSDEGTKDLLEGLAYGFDALAGKIVERVKSLAPVGAGIHPDTTRFPSRKRKPVAFHYRDTIKSTTYLTGERIAGQDIRAGGFNPASSPIVSIIYSTWPLAHLFEITGAKPHTIPGTIGAGGHPGIARRPHFVPGLFSALAEANITARTSGGRRGNRRAP